ncbi:MAG: hypothetical protein KIS78_06380 [Labilithrix sp.]|nr:hypothetical protein [Labilithrix sp.]
MRDSLPAIVNGKLSRTLLVAAAIASLPLRSARADTKQECLSSYVEAQRTRRLGKLRAAREAATSCSRVECPDAIRGDCVAWSRELETSVPTVVVSVVAPDGSERADARVLLDGEEIATKLDGRAIEVDPGEHVFRVELEGAPPIEQTIVIRQGEHDRAVRLSARPAPPIPQRQAPEPPPAPATSTARPVPPIVYVLGALSVAGAATWAGVGFSAIYGSPGVKELDECSPRCRPNDRVIVERELDVAGIAGAFALVTGGAALYFYLTRPSSGVAVVPARGGALVGWNAFF